MLLGDGQSAFRDCKNVLEDKEPVIIAVRKERGLNVLEELNETLITRKYLVALP